MTTCDSPVAHNNLGGLGPGSGAPTIRYANVTEGVDMIIKNVSEYVPWNVQVNGMSGDCFGMLSLACGQKVDLVFTFVNPIDLTEVPVTRFFFTLSDIDEGLSGRCRESVTVSGYKEFSVAHSTRLNVTETNGSVIFSGTKTSSQADNPDSAALTTEQEQQSVSFEFTETAMFRVTYSTQPSSSNDPQDKGYAGRRLLFTTTVASLLAGQQQQ